MADQKATTVDIALKANASLVLPTLLVGTLCEKNGRISTLTKHFEDADSLSGKGVIKLSTVTGDQATDDAAFQHFIDLLGDSFGAKDADVIEWIKRSKVLTALDFKTVKKPLEELNNHLLLRSYIIGHSLTVADLAVWGTLRGNRVVAAFVKKANNNVTRWFSFIEEFYHWPNEVAVELYVESLKEKQAQSSVANYDLGLPEFDGPMVTRFPPEPSGYLHIGHAKAALLNDHFAHKKPGGKLICRFDDTNPSKEKMEFQEAIIEDLKLMEIYPDQTSYSSDYFQLMYEYAVQLIKDGKAFADDSELGKGDEDRKNRLPSKRRDMNIEDTLARFEDMKSGSTEGQRWCIRARIAYDSPNGTLRDPVIYRCNQLPHHRTGTTWKIYPTYDFCAPILDSVEGVTLALRTNEYRDRNVQYEWMQEALKLRSVTIWDFSRMNFVRTLLSKRKLTRIVDDGKVWGWDDPRMPTIRGILRRGMTVQALREFIIAQGPSRNILNLEWGAFWALNKKEIDPKVPRHTAIVEEKAVYCDVKGIDKPSEQQWPRHSKNPSLGSKRVLYDKTIVVEQVDAQSFEKDEEVTLMSWGNAFVRDIVHEADGKTVSKLTFELHLDGDVKKTKKKITWLAAVKENLLPVDLVAFDYLITKDKLEKDDEPLEKFLTPKTEFRTAAFADCNVTHLPPGSAMQFERKGYYKLDIKSAGQKPSFFDIPTGKL